jgi:phosphoribosylamine---glycine ligase
MRQVLIVGEGGREASIAARFHHDNPDLVINSVMRHANPTIVSIVRDTGGMYAIADSTDPDNITTLLEFEITARIDLAVVTSDASLANGVVDALEALGIPCFGPNKAAARIEWDKPFMRELVAGVDPSLNPFHRMTNGWNLSFWMRVFQDRGIPVVVKPTGLTGGKGVKVMGPHFDTYDEGLRIAMGVLAAGDEHVLLEERIDLDASIEFTVQAFTDGTHVVIPPATYGYPFRFDGDTGPGTGGMGAFTDGPGLGILPQDTLDRATVAIQGIVDALRGRGLPFKGILNVGFFATPTGLKVIECNARPGDPECINMMMLTEGDMPDIMHRIATGTLTDHDLRFADLASVVVYVVDESYALPDTPTLEPFTIDHSVLHTDTAHLFHAASIISPYGYRGVGSSRIAAVGATAQDLPAAYEKVYNTIDLAFNGPSLDYRREIGAEEYVRTLAARDFGEAFPRR